MRLRRPTEHDLAQFGSFHCWNYGEKWTKAVQRGIRRDLAQMVVDEEIEVVVAVDDACVVGVIGFEHAGEVGHISTLAVVPSHRRQGSARN